jgi:hypothetical protein
MSASDDGRPEKILFVADGSAPARYHVRDQEAFTGALPPIPVTPADRAALTPVRLGAYPATLWLPSPDTAEPLEGPDPPRSQGWEWPSGEWLMLVLWPRPELPALHAVSGYPAGAVGVRVAGRPMAVEVPHPDPAGSGEVADGAARFAYTVSGYLDDATHLWVDLDAPTPAQRDHLLAALLTLAVDAGHARAAVPRVGA